MNEKMTKLAKLDWEKQDHHRNQMINGIITPDEFIDKQKNWDLKYKELFNLLMEQEKKDK